MNKTVVLFKSKTGYTFQYAQWIAKALKCDVIENNKLDVSELDSYSIIIIGGGVYAGNLNGIDFLLKHWERLRTKKIFIFAVGAANGNSDMTEQIWSRNLTAEQRKEVKCFYLRGGFDYSRISTKDRLLMRCFQIMLKWRKQKTLEAKEVLGWFSHSVDFTSEENIIPIIQAVMKGSKTASP